jgi:putative oxidoreductase
MIARPARLAWAAAGLAEGDNMSEAVAALGRVLLSAIFIWAGFGKIGDPTGTMHYIASAGMPVPSAAYVVAVIVELGGGLALLLGWQARAVAAALAIFCVVTAAVFHSHFADHMMLIQFMKNVAMAGGLLQVTAYGAGAVSLDAMLSGRRSFGRISGRIA